MRELRSISNEEFELELNSLDNIRIMESAVSGYRTSIPDDEIQRCKLIALWEALRRSKYEPGQKLNMSFLYQRVKWECQIYLNKERKLKRRRGQLLEDTALVEVLIDTDIQDVIDQLPPKIGVVIRQRFFDGMNLKDIGEANNFSHETARRYINEGLRRIKLLLEKADK